MSVSSGSPAIHALRSSGYGLAAACTMLLVLAACDGFDSDDSNRINGSVHVPVGKPPGDAHTVNGAIHIDDNATVNIAATVNGSVRLGAHGTATSLQTVNGSISVGPAARVSGSVKSVNGDLSLADGADVAGSLANVNGKIRLTAAHVAGGIRTVSGNINIMGASHVEGGILVEQSSGGLFSGEDPLIIIGPGVIVQGELHFERKVRLFVSDKATIGTVTGATAVPFSGDSPPP
jgi:DUF4097 and DUF4098 domain-containing protein YvlB